MRIPFFSLQRQQQSIHRELAGAFSAVSRRGRFILGENVERFEKQFAAFQKSRYCITVGNGHDALFIALKINAIGKGDEVIVPSHTCQATWLAVANCGAKPVPVDVDPSTYVINPSLIEEKISTRTKAIMPVHLYGQPCAMDELMKIAKRHQLTVIEDNAQAQGAMFNGKMTGSWGDCNATSFYPTKNLGAMGDGGAITTNHRNLAEGARAIRNYGSTKKDIHPTLGINSRLDELQAAILLIKLKKLKQWNRERVSHAKAYSGLLAYVGDIQSPMLATDSAQPVFHQYVIQTNRRDSLKKYLERKGIETAIHYPTPVHRQPAYHYLKYREGSLPVAEKLSQTVLSLPVWPGLRKEEIEWVAEEIQRFFKR